ncbi:hypothetical protein LWI29_033356 [Acer saccharum]|uniref:Uncharacterized protein n=1 Tax=Acer saccharum TaxID=4024 RepID=A0AA39RHJ3_ACESA|nr:hypothetical protein LWI29_033356 [Acer saccharum]
MGSSKVGAMQARSETAGGDVGLGSDKAKDVPCSAGYGCARADCSGTGAGCGGKIRRRQILSDMLARKGSSKRFRAMIVMGTI